ncbi:MAG: DNA alkylation repair protein [Candidatus Micrarchaeota archaeon]
MASCAAIVRSLKSRRNAANIAGMARFGISTKNTLGVSVPVLRSMAMEIGKDHELALQLWKTGIHEARLLAGFIDDPAKVTEAQMESWAADFDSWDTTDQVCGNLFDRTPFAYNKAVEWSAREEEFVKRAGFALMAALAVHDKKAGDGKFLKFLPIIAREATDERNFVRKAVNWALRQIGKSRNRRLHAAAIASAKEIARTDSKAAKWIAADALRELAGPAVQKRLARDGG